MVDPPLPYRRTATARRDPDPLNAGLRPARPDSDRVVEAVGYPLVFLRAASTTVSTLLLLPCRQLRIRIARPPVLARDAARHRRFPERRGRIIGQEREVRFRSGNGGVSEFARRSPSERGRLTSTANPGFSMVDRTTPPASRDCPAARALAAAARPRSTTRGLGHRRARVPRPWPLQPAVARSLPPLRSGPCARPAQRRSAGSSPTRPCGACSSSDGSLATGHPCHSPARKPQDWDVHDLHRNPSTSMVMMSTPWYLR